MQRVTSEEILIDDLPNMSKLTELLHQEKRLDSKLIIDIFTRVSKIVAKEENLIHVQDPVCIVGDLHGQFYDLQKVFEIGGSLDTIQYLFLGDYIDRGNFGCEILIQLCCLKILHPTRIWMLRGNHECRHITSFFNFRQECLYKYDQQVYDVIMTFFDCLPLAALINDRFLAVHGGISPEITCLEDINAIHRFGEPPSSGPFCDLLWSDPSTDKNQQEDFEFNTVRNCSYLFSYEAVSEFLEANSLLSIFRAHEVQDVGYRLYRNGQSTGFPTVVCVFSAPNYCDTYGNYGAVIKLVNNAMNIRQFKASPHPYYLPNFMNVFQWSLPFVTTKLTELMGALILYAAREDRMEQDQMMDESSIKVLKGKILALGKMQRLFNTLKNEKESIDLLKIYSGGVLPVGLLSLGGVAIKDALERFQLAKKKDEINEKRPIQLGESVSISKSISFKGKLKPVEKVQSLESPLILVEDVEDEE
jgi:serine/threonine-protein phosphatase 2B catalytic subunit